MISGNQSHVRGVKRTSPCKAKLKARAPQLRSSAGRG